MSYFKTAKKSLGQNFLIDQNIVNKIIKITNINKKNTVLEIGAGSGNLTKKIVSMKPKEILAVEKDKKLVIILKRIFKDCKNIKIINEDILDIINNDILGQNIIVFGNLPYNISTKILTTLTLLKKWPPWYETLIFMFQKEVANRIIAKNNSKDFGRLSVLCNWRFNIKKHFDVSKNCFLPKPKVDSTVLSFIPKINNAYYLENPKNLETVTRVLFSNRRKMINKSFIKLFGDDKSIIKELNLNLKQRPEELSREIFYKIALKYEKLFN